MIVYSSYFLLSAAIVSTEFYIFSWILQKTLESVLITQQYTAIHLASSGWVNLWNQKKYERVTAFRYYEMWESPYTETHMSHPSFDFSCALTQLPPPLWRGGISPEHESQEMMDVTDKPQQIDYQLFEWKTAPHLDKSTQSFDIAINRKVLCTKSTPVIRLIKSFNGPSLRTDVV